MNWYALFRSFNAKHRVDKHFVEGNMQCDRVVQRRIVVVHSGADPAAADFENFFIQHLERRAQLARCFTPDVLVKL